jgi:nucleoside-diphosphate-sugar epimerase
VARWLLDGGADLITIQRGRTGPSPPGARSLVAERGDAGALQAALADAAPAVLIDMIAYTAADAERLLAALPSSLERLVVISSGDVYWTYGAFLGLDSANPPATPLDEDAPLRQARYPYRAQASGADDVLYSYEKIEVERIARDGAGVPVTVLRLPMVYGRDDPQGRIAGYLARLGAGAGRFRLNSAESAWRCTRGYVEDVAAAIALAALDGKAADAIYNLGESDAPTERVWVEAVAEAAGWEGEIVVEPDTPPSLQARWEFPLATDTRRIREELGYREPVGRTVGLRRSVA